MPSDPVTLAWIALLGVLVQAVVLPFFAFWLRKLEKNTNSIKDALVASTARENSLVGEEQGRLKEQARQAVRLEAPAAVPIANTPTIGGLPQSIAGGPVEPLQPGQIPKK